MRITIIRLPRHLLAASAVALAGCTALLLSLCFPPASRPALAPALIGRTLVIDPGHGGWDPGVSGPLGPESEINLAVAQKLAEYCQQAGATVILTREADKALDTEKRAELQKRVDLADENQAAVFLSIHCNSFVGDRSQHGAQFFYQAHNAEGQRLAELLQASLSQELGNSQRVALAHPDSYLLRNLPIPAVIAEIGFLTNQEEEALLHLESYQWKLAWALYLGLNSYFAGEAISGT